MSLRARILLLVLLATVVPALGFGAFALIHRNGEVNDAKRNLSSLAAYAAENLDGKVKGAVQLLHGLSRAPEIDTADQAACSAFLAGVLARYPQYTGILTLTPAGDLHCDSLRTGRKLNVSTRDYFRQVSASLEPAFDTVIGGLTGIAVLQVAYPVLDRQGRLKYVLLASLNLSQYAQDFAAASPYAGIRMLIWNRGGNLMVYKPDDAAARGFIGARFAESELFRFAASAPAGATAQLPGLKGERRVWALGVLPEASAGGPRITLGVPLGELAAEADEMLRNALAGLAGVSLLAFAAAWYVAETGIRRPVRRIAAVAGRVGAGELGARVGAPYPRGDLGELMVVVDRMAGAVQAQRAEIESRSRELGRANRTLRVLSGINSAIVRIRDRQELFAEACRIAVEDGGFKMAWIGVVDRASMMIEPIASAGVEPGFMALIKDRFSLREDAPMGNTMSARAVREKKPMVSNEIQGDARVLDVKQRAQRGIVSMAILPLVVAGEAVGVLALYAGEKDFFDAGEMALLAELADDVGFALDHIDKAEKVRYLGSYDPLTGLANGTLFHERLAGIVETARAARGSLAVYVLDVERFKTINDTLGRSGGDELIRQIAARLTGTAGESAHFARVGPDRFAVVAPGVQGEDAAARLAGETLDRCFGAPFGISGNELRVSAKFGVAMFPDDGENAATLFRNAEAALKQAKAGGDRYLFHTRKMTERVAEDLALQNKLRQALVKDEFVLHYQPKVDVDSRETVGFEALIRWQSPALGLVPPVEFIPLLEETGLILEVGAWALKRAAADHRRWSEAGLKPPRVAVNVSPIQLRQRDFVRSVEQAIIEGVAPVGIDLEITESLIMQDVEATIGKLEAVRRLGLKIAIDDFGTGYSSLAYLSKLPVTALKIDRAFIQAMLDGPNSATLVQAIISMAHALRLKVIAEGVETGEQAKMLQLLRCDEMQGFLFSKPLAAAGIEAMLGLKAQAVQVMARADIWKLMK